MILDETSFERLYYTYAPRLCNYAHRFLRDRQMAEDLVQEGILFSAAGPVGLPLDGGVSGYNVVTVRGGKVTCRFVNL